MRHALPDIERGIDVGCDGTLDVLSCVVQQHLVVADMDADRRQASELAIQGGRRGVRGYAMAQVGGDQGPRLGAA